MTTCTRCCHPKQAAHDQVDAIIQDVVSILVEPPSDCQKPHARQSPLLRLGKVREIGGELIRYTQVAFSPGSREEVSTASIEALDDLRETALVDLEDGILLLDRALRQRTRAWLQRRAEERTARA